MSRLKKVLGILGIILLVITIIGELIYGATMVFGIVGIRTLGALGGKGSDELFNTLDTLVDNVNANAPSTIYDTGEGDVVKFNGYKFRIGGTLLSTDTISQGYTDYLAFDGDMHNITSQTCYGNEDLLEALDDYIQGDYELVKHYLPVTVQDENLTCYLQDTPDGVLAEIYDEGSQKWYMFVPMTDVYMLLIADDMIMLSRDAETVIFGDPSDDVMSEHTYSLYEMQAVENTRNALTDGTYTPTGDEQLSSEVQGTSATYTSAADNETRKQMLNMANYVWKSDGTSEDTNMIVDLTSTTAKASEWVLTTSSPYAFTDNALRLHSLKAVRNAETFNVSGKLTNQLAAERPYVIILKFLNANDELLGIRVLDKRNERIPPNDVADWTYVLSIDSGISIGEINALQFEIY